MTDDMAKKNDTVNNLCMQDCIRRFDEARSDLVLAVAKGTMLRPLAESGLEMVECYRTDAENFCKGGDYVTAFAAINYAHAWIGCFRSYGLFGPGPYEELFIKLDERDSDASSAITDERMAKYLDITTRARKKVKISPPVRSFDRKLALDFLEKSETYFKTAVDYRRDNDYLRAFAAVNYSHAWLDGAARIGLFDVEGDDVLFTLYE
jgi:hypothetical protein